MAARIVGDRLAYVAGEQQPRRASRLPRPAPAQSDLADPEEAPEADADPLGRPLAEPGSFHLVQFSRLHVIVVCALLIVGLALAVVALLRARPVAVATAQPGVSISAQQAPATTSGEASGSQSPVTQIVVHVLGAVRRPGLVRLPEHSRVSDAIEAAGGLRSSAAPGELNLAQIVSDGQQIVIGSRGDPGAEVRDGGAAASARNASPGTSAPLDLNTATAAQLDTLPGIGPVTAERILAWRSDHGRFRQVEELQEVEGIGPKTYAQIAPLVRV